MGNFLSNDFTAGCGGGIVGTVFSHPIDTMKTRMQSEISFKNSLQMRKFYIGVGSPLFGVPLEKSIVFGCCDVMKKMDVSSFWSGFIAGFISAGIVTPIEFLKINAQKDVNFSIIKSLKNPKVFKMIYTGFTPTVLRESVGYGVYFYTYDTLTSMFNKERKMMKTFLFGGITGFTSWIVIYPTDLVKTRSQDNNNNQNVKQIVKNIYKKDGIFGFYKNMHWALGRAVFLHAGVFGGYELFKKSSDILN